jgi:hypothetical protein
VWKGLRVSKMEKLFPAVTHLALECRLKDNAFSEKVSVRNLRWDFKNS